MPTVLDSVRSLRAYLKLEPAARAAARADRGGPPAADPGIDRVVREGLAWIGRAQDASASADGGVARHWSYRTGWSTSYPETTGYIVPTMLECAAALGDAELRARGRRMLDWLVAIQMPDGGFQGGMIGQTPVVSVTFNTGQILMGLAAGVRELGEAYRPAMDRAARFLVDSLDPDGCWRRHPTPFAQPGEKAYETHVSWGLLEAARASEGAARDAYADAALRQVAWALTKQQPNGWFASNDLEDPAAPLTHTIGYVLRGVVEAWRYARDVGHPEAAGLLAAARRTADGLLPQVGADGFLPGRLDRDWQGTVRWACLTGSVQIAHSLLLLFQETGEARYRDAAYRLNAYVRRTVLLDAPPSERGAVKGSFPVSGGYCTYQFPNWATKFSIDAQRLEQQVRAAG